MAEPRAKTPPGTRHRLPRPGGTAGALFPALLRYWRERRGLSQLELSLQADVSTRHLSFLESNRARPSEEMVLGLLSVLGVPLRDQNEALLAAGFAARFPTPAIEEIAPEIDQALAQMMAQHEPFPLTVLSLDGTIVRSNRAASRLFEKLIAEPSAMQHPTDMFDLFFDPRLMRPFIVDWASFARGITSRLHREQLQRGDARLATVLDRLFSYPGVPRQWRQPDFATAIPPTLRIHLAREALRVSFLITVTVFSAPQQVTLDELRIESCFPLDAETRAVCEQLAAHA